jgi:uncharacterized protein (UPF0332 family)
MELKTLNDCFKYRKLRKIKPDKEKSHRSMELAKKNIEKIKSFLDEKKQVFFEIIIINSYMAMFHAARAVLYSDGIQEKNHYAIYIYLKEKYKDIVPLPVLNLLNIHRAQRHEAIYGLEFKPDKEDAEIAFDDAQIFIKEMEKIIKKG